MSSYIPPLSAGSVTVADQSAAADTPKPLTFGKVVLASFLGSALFSIVAGIAYAAITH